jgi:hypothetical protein
MHRLQYLETLYRQGYHSAVLDRSLDKIMALERAAARREYADLRERLQAFETRYQMSSEDFYRPWITTIATSSCSHIST